MTIQNDIVTFEKSDVEQFSVEQRQALQAYAGDRVTLEVYLSELVNSALSRSRQAFVANRLDALKDPILKADSGTMEQAKTLIAQIENLVL